MKKSIFLKLFLPISVLFLLVIIAIAAMTPELVKRNAQSNALHSAQTMVNQLKQLRAYYTKNVVKKVIGRDGLKGSFNHQGNPDAIPLPATMIHELSELYSAQGTTVKLYSAFPFPNRSNRQLDSFGQEAWDTLTQNPEQTVVRNQTMNGEPVVRVAIADRMVSEVCVGCHNSHPDTPKSNWKMNDVRGVLEVDFSIQEQLANGQTIVYSILAMVVTAMILAYLVLLFIYRKTIGQRLKALLNAMDDISHGEGDLRHRLPAQGEDEISLIAKAFNTFSGNMQSTVKEVKQIASDYLQASQQLADTTRQGNDAIQQQCNETDQIATAINELAAAAEEVSRHAGDAAHTTDESNKNVNITNISVKNSIAEIQKLSTMFEGAAQTMNDLNDGAENVGGVIEVIRGIAEQTNLLALNAAIEAARAGEQGRGFAVVADEVRTLAARTQQSTDEIREMIERLQMMSQRAVSTMQESQEQAEQSVTKAMEAGDSLGVIVDSINQANEINSQIAAAAEEQSQVVSSIDENVMKITNLANETMSSTELIGTQSEEVAKMSSRLEALLARFKV